MEHAGHDCAADANTYAAGAVVSGASPAYNVEEMTYALKTADAKFLATSPTSMAVAKEAAKNAGLNQGNLILLEGQMDGLPTIQDLIETGRSYGADQEPAFSFPSGKTNKAICAFLSFSSGTTGLPKAVMISHHNMIAQCLQAHASQSPWTKNVLAVLPLFHVTGLAWILHIPILLNEEVYLLPYYEMNLMCKTIETYQINELLLVPPLLIRLVRDPDVKKYDLSCVKGFSTGAAPVSVEILSLLEKQFPGTAFKQGYGMTESCSCITSTDPKWYDYKWGASVGTICSSTEVKIVKDDGTEAGVDEEGELLARGPQITMGYLNNEKATRETYEPDGFLRTGDIATIDSEGRVWIRDRKKELIKVSGIGVAPAELEDLLLGHPLVEDAAVVGITDEYSGELPKAFVKLGQGGTGSEEIGKDIMKYVSERKVKHKRVREVQFVSEIPKSASGKILRRLLRDGKSGAGGLVVTDRARAEKARL